MLENSDHSRATEADRQIYDRFQKVRDHGDLNTALGIRGSLIAHGFVIDWSQQGDKVDMHPVPAKLPDHYLHRAPIAIPGSGDNQNEQAVMFESFEGHFDHMQHAGALGRDAAERFCILPREESVQTPHGDLELQLLHAIRANQHYFRERFEGLTLIPIFPSVTSERLAEAADMELLNTPDGVYGANNKVLLRRNAEKYGYGVPNGIETYRLESEQELSQILEYAADKIAGGTDIWIKYPTGSGGDLVVGLKAEDFAGQGQENIQEALNQALSTIALNVLQSRNPQLTECSWEDVLMVLRNGGLVIEEHVNGGYSNINAQAIVGPDGITMIDLSLQLTGPQGDYIGNTRRPIEVYSADFLGAVEREMINIGTYLRQEHRARMVFGVDMFVEGDPFETHSGKRDIRSFDGNGRFNVSTGVKMRAANRQGRHPFALNTNIALPRVPGTYSDILEMIGSENLQGLQQAGVLPFLPRLTTNIVKCDIVGDSDEHVNRIVTALGERGIRTV